MTTITLDGGPELKAALLAASQDMVEAAERAVTATGLELRGNVVKRIQRGPKTGRIYTRGSVTHKASRAGEAPASDTGRLAGSVTFEQVGPITVTVGSALAYAAYLEYGTRHIAPRPAWRPAVDDIEPKFRKRLEQALAVAVK